MDIIVLAGGETTQQDPLYPVTADGNKSLTMIAGKPMVQWVLDAISGTPSINNVVVIGVSPKHQVQCSKPIQFLSDSGSLIENIQQGAALLQKLNPIESHAITISADIPTVTPAIIESMIAKFQPGNVDIHYAVVDRYTMEKRFPDSRRTYIKFKDAEVCGGDLNCVRKSAVLNPDALWRDLIKQRKNPIRQASLIGWWTLILLLLGNLTLDDAVSRVCQKLKIKGNVILSPHAEIGMDVDKIRQFDIVQQDLARMMNDSLSQ